MKFFASAFIIASAAIVAVPAAAQDDGGDKVRMVIVYGDDAAPEPEGDEIIVVGRKPESERFRIPENLRTSGSPANRSWADRVERFEMIGRFGTLSCDPAGAGGFLGCTQKMIDEAYKDKAEGADVRFGQLIEMARTERLSTIDEDAAAEQERVESLERAYLDRLERERDAPIGNEVPTDNATGLSMPPAEILDPAAPDEMPS